jgi:hypothetical protein
MFLHLQKKNSGWLIYFAREKECSLNYHAMKSRVAFSRYIFLRMSAGIINCLKYKYICVYDKIPSQTSNVTHLVPSQPSTTIQTNDHMVMHDSMEALDMSLGQVDQMWCHTQENSIFSSSMLITPKCIDRCNTSQYGSIGYQTTGARR